MAFASSRPISADHLASGGRTPPWERPLTPRQAYWLSCLREAVASVERATGHRLPVPLSTIAKVDQNRHGGIQTAATATIIDTLGALAVRRWVVPGELPPALQPPDRRCSTVGYELADRSELTTEAEELAKLRPALARCEALIAKTRQGLQGFNGRWEDEVELSKLLKEKRERQGRILAIEERISERIGEGAQGQPHELPPALLPDNIARAALLASCEPRAARAATPNPYGE